MLCKGDKNVGETYVDKIGWKHVHKVSDQCGNRIKARLLLHHSTSNEC